LIWIFQLDDLDLIGWRDGAQIIWSDENELSVFMIQPFFHKLIQCNLATTHSVQVEETEGKNKYRGVSISTRLKLRSIHTYIYALIDT
jgi:hypothetical protein